ncbi:Quinidine resistance protein 2 [Talaromyces pinophilus]|nr:Quinidine resistance protein 2 [Talaromyces pinophilus]
MFSIYLLFIPETCRNIVGNGSIPPQSWNKPAIQYVKDKRKKNESRDAAKRETMSKKQRPNLLSSIPILFQKESFLILIYGAFVYSGYIMILTGLPRQLSSTYNYNSIQVGLCYIPIGVGPIIIRPIVGRVMDANFRRYTRKSGVATIDNNVQQDIDNLPIERIRLEISLAFVYISSIAILPYGWVMGLQKPPLPAVLVMLFIMGLCTSASVQPLTALIIDINPKSPAAAGAAFNLVRCLLAAGGAAIVNPLLNSIGRGWTGTLVALSWILLSVCWWAVIILGPKWRKQAKKAESKQETA